MRLQKPATAAAPRGASSAREHASTSPAARPTAGHAPCPAPAGRCAKAVNADAQRVKPPVRVRAWTPRRTPRIAGRVAPHAHPPWCARKASARAGVPGFSRLARARASIHPAARRTAERAVTRVRATSRVGWAPAVVRQGKALAARPDNASISRRTHSTAGLAPMRAPRAPPARRASAHAPWARSFAAAHA